MANYSNINDIKLYAEKTKTLSKSIKAVFKSFQGLYYLPPYFWFVLLNEGECKFEDLLFQSTHSSFLLWNETTLNVIKEKLNTFLNPLYKLGFSATFHPYFIKFSFAEQITCGPMLLLNWSLSE